MSLDHGAVDMETGTRSGNASGSVLPFDLPVAVGFMPLVFQNGIWLENNGNALTHVPTSWTVQAPDNLLI